VEDYILQHLRPMWFGIDFIFFGPMHIGNMQLIKKPIPKPIVAEKLNSFKVNRESFPSSSSLSIFFFPVSSRSNRSQRRFNPSCST
jgi:hypothetical protein